MLSSKSIQLWVSSCVSRMMFGGFGRLSSVPLIALLEIQTLLGDLGLLIRGTCLPSFFKLFPCTGQKVCWDSEQRKIYCVMWLSMCVGGRVGITLHLIWIWLPVVYPRNWFWVLWLCLRQMSSILLLTCSWQPMSCSTFFRRSTANFSKVHLGTRAADGHLETRFI